VSVHEFPAVKEIVIPAEAGIQSCQYVLDPRV
jgi:hypothetical protein